MRLDRYSAKKELATTAAGKNSYIDSEEQLTDALYNEKIAIAQREGRTDEALQLQYEKEKALCDLEVERHQNLADEYQSNLDMLSAQKENLKTAAEKNDVIESEKSATQALYAEKIAIAQIEGSAAEALQLQEKLKKTLLDLEIEKHQNLADEYQANLDMLSAQKENLKTASDKNDVVDNEKNLTVQLYREKIGIAEIEGKISEQMQLQAELAGQLVQFEKEKLDNIAEYYKNLRKINENQAKNLANSLNELEARGLVATNRLYEEQRKLNDEKKRNYEAELVLLERQHDNIETGTQEWYDSLDSIQTCKDEIAGCVMNAIELGDAIRNISWQIFEKMSSRLGLLSSEYELATELMSDKQLTDKDTGNFTKEGTATLGAYYSELLLAQEKTGEFKRTLDEMKRHIDNGDDGYTDQKALDEYLEKHGEYINLIKSEHGIQKNITDLMKQKYQAELDYLQDIISKRKELLQAEKDAYDYQRSIEEKTKNVAVIAKQMAALGGDGSEAAKTRLQQLQVSLDEANRDLQDTEYNQWLSDQQKMLDNLYNEYSDFIDDKLNDTDALIREAVTYLSNINVGKSVGDCLNDYYSRYGYDPADDFANITNELGENGSIVKAIGDCAASIIAHSESQQKYQSLADSVTDAVSGIGNVFEDSGAIRRYRDAATAYSSLKTAGDNGENIQQYVDSASVSVLKNTGESVRKIQEEVARFRAVVSGIEGLDDISGYNETNARKIENAENLYKALPTSGKQLAESYRRILDGKIQDYEGLGAAIRLEHDKAAKEAAAKAAAERAAREAAAKAAAEQAAREAAARAAAEQENQKKRTSFEKIMRETYLADASIYADTNGSEEHNDDLNNLLKSNGLFRDDDGFSINKAGIARVMGELGWSRSCDHTPSGMLRLMKSIGFSGGGIAKTLQKVPGMNGDDGWVTVENGEGILTPEQTQEFIKLVRGLDTLNPAVDLVKDLSGRNYKPVTNRFENQSVGEVNIEMNLPNVTNYEDFRRQMQSDPKIEKMFKSMIWEKGDFSKYSIKM